MSLHMHTQPRRPFRGSTALLPLSLEARTSLQELIVLLAGAKARSPVQAGPREQN